MTGTSSTRPREHITDTTALRHFALIGQVSLLARLMGGVVHVPREILDPDEAVDSVVLSEIGNALRYINGPRYVHPDREEHAQRLRDLSVDRSVAVVDLDDEELAEASRLSGRQFARQMRRARLGAGEAAVMAVALARDWTAVIDDKDARTVLASIKPHARTVTCQTLLRVGAGDVLVSSEAQLVYLDLVKAGFRGPPSLWEE